jgi:tetratricopeptide (TPR) repeat protein
MATEQLPGSYCQNCLAWNPGDRETCLKCGTRLMIVLGDQTWEEEAEEDGGEDLEEHLLERITNLEEGLRRVETYLETVSDQLAKLERSEVMLRNGLMALVQEMDAHKQLDPQAFSERWEHLVDENLHLIRARELFTRYRARILPIARPKSMAQLRRALAETAALLEQGNLPEAADRLEEALQQDPKNYELLFTVASLQEAAQAWETAETLARKAIQLSPRHFEAWMMLGRLIMDDPDRADEAVEALNKAADLRPDDAEPRLLLAELLEHQEDLQGALEAATEAVARRRDGETLLRLGSVHLARGEGAKAVAIFKDATDLLPGDAGVREHLAEGYLVQGERSKAFAILQELLQQHPGDHDLLLLLDAENVVQLRTARDGKPGTQGLLDEVETLLTEGLLEEADQILRRVKRKGGSERSDWLELRMDFQRDPENHLEDALAFSRSQRHPRLCFQALRLVLEHAMGTNDEALIQRGLETFLQAHPKSSGAFEAALMRAAHKLLHQTVDEADLREVKRLASQPLPGLESRSRGLLGQYLLALQKPQEVLELLDPVLEKEPTVMNHFQLGAALAQLGDKKEAQGVLRAGLEADEGDLSEEQAQSVRNQIQGLLKELGAKA